MLKILINLHTIMKSKDFTYSLRTIDVNAKVSEVKPIYDDAHIKHIAVLDQEIFVGLLDSETISNIEDEGLLTDHRHLLNNAFLFEDFTLFDWLKIKSIGHTDFVPILDADFKYTGVLSHQQIIESFGNTGLIVDLSSTLTITKETTHFNYSEVFQIAESNGAKIFGSYIKSSDQDHTEVVLNIYHTGLNELLQSFRRYGYDIISYHDEDLHHETLRANSDYFSKYLTV
jgi:predicted transcriptional regulator